MSDLSRFLKEEIENFKNAAKSKDQEITLKLFSRKEIESIGQAVSERALLDHSKFDRIKKKAKNIFFEDEDRLKAIFVFSYSILKEEVFDNVDEDERLLISSLILKYLLRQNHETELSIEKLYDFFASVKDLDEFEIEDAFERYRQFVKLVIFQSSKVSKREIHDFFDENRSELKHVFIKKLNFVSNIKQYVERNKAVKTLKISVDAEIEFSKTKKSHKKEISVLDFYKADVDGILDSFFSTRENFENFKEFLSGSKRKIKFSARIPLESFSGIKKYSTFDAEDYDYDAKSILILKDDSIIIHTIGVAFKSISYYLGNAYPFIASEKDLIFSSQIESLNEKVYKFLEKKFRTIVPNLLDEDSSIREKLDFSDLNDKLDEVLEAVPQQILEEFFEVSIDERKLLSLRKLEDFPRMIEKEIQKLLSFLEKSKAEENKTTKKRQKKKKPKIL